MDEGQTTHPAEVEAARAVVLVEGISDQRALEALAERRGRNLDAEGVSVVPIGGAQAIGKFLKLFGPQGLDVRLAGLYDAAEEGDFRRGLERAGFGSDLTRAELERLGFYVCDADLEDELIRALGAASVEAVVETQGELGSFRTLQKQPAWQGRPTEEQLRRFMGSGGRRKIRYARLLVEALDLDSGASATRLGTRSCLKLGAPTVADVQRIVGDLEPSHPQSRDHPVLLASRRKLRGGERRGGELVHIRDVGLAAGGAHDSRRGPARAPRRQARRR